MIEAYCFLNIVYRIGLSLQQRKKHAVYFNYSEEKFYFYYIFLGGGINCCRGNVHLVVYVPDWGGVDIDQGVRDLGMGFFLLVVGCCDLGELAFSWTQSSHLEGKGLVQIIYKSFFFSLFLLVLYFQRNRGYVFASYCTFD